MCGIAGIVRLDGGIEYENLEAMCERIHHRGPDAGGIYTEVSDDFWVGIGSRRLSIIDLSAAGNMPMSSENDDVWIAYNGELYNHQALRRELLAKGHVYRSQTDTETIIHAYEEYGVAALQRFNGMFAFVIYDRAHSRVLIARDQMGIKPLYYTWDGVTLRFASELKALTSAETRVNPTALSLYFSLGYVPAPYTLIEGVHKLPAGSYLMLENGQLHQGTYWSPTVSAEENGRSGIDYVARTRQVMEDAVVRQLMSDVPVGVFLSGGIDSTLVAAVAKKHHNEALNTFSVGFESGHGTPQEEALYNQDMLFARQVADQLGTRHHEILIPSGTRIIDLLTSTISFMDEPVWETSFVSLHMMSKLAREHGVIVVLTGDGGDELFAGYPWYEGARRFETYYSRIPFLKSMLPLLSAVSGDSTIGVKARDLHRKLGQDEVTRYRMNYDIFSETDKHRLFRQTGTDPLVDFITPRLAATGARDLPQKLAMMDLMLWVREHFNQRVDRMSMMNSIEARVPFQDVEVVNFALSVPMSVKMQGGVGKYLLREAFKDVIPDVVLQRPKRPFATPTQSWLRGPLRDFVQDTLSPSAVDLAGLLDTQMVRSLVDDFMAGDNSPSFKIWALLNFQIWYEAFAGQPVTV